MNIIAIATEVVGGPWDGDLVVCESDSFNADRQTSKYARDHVISRPRIITYIKQTAYTDFNNELYFRDYFICEDTDSNAVYSSLRKSLCPIYLSKEK